MLMKFKYVKNCLILCLLAAVALLLGGCKKSTLQGSIDDTSSKDVSSVVSDVLSEPDNVENESYKNPSSSSQVVKDNVSVSSKTENSSESHTESSKENGAKADSSSLQTSAPVSSNESKEDTPEETKVSLPTVGYRLDERLRVKAVSLSENTVTLEIENTSKLWVPEDDTSVCYICKDKNGKELKKEKITIGSIDGGTSKTYRFDIPTSSTSVELSELEVNYWSVTA